MIERIFTILIIFLVLFTVIDKFVRHPIATTLVIISVVVFGFGLRLITKTEDN